MENLKNAAGRSLYALAGILLCVIILSGKISEVLEYRYAYKFPAKTIKEKIDKYKRIAYAKKTDTVITGNAKIETKPDGTTVATGDKIETKSDEKKDETTRDKSSKTETTTPVLPGGEWIFSAGLNLDLSRAKAGAAFRISNQIELSADYILDLKAPDLKSDKIFLSVGIRP